MVVVKPFGHGGLDAFLAGRTMAGLAQTGAMDYSNGFGFAVCGKSRLGDDRQQGGIYQKRVTGYNQFGRNPDRPRRSYYVKMRSYAPTNPRTPAQQARRNKFADARAAWAVLDDNLKIKYNKRATKQGRYGWRLFVSEYMKDPNND